MLVPDHTHTDAFLSMLAGLDTFYDFRALHDRERGRPGIALRGTHAQHAAELARLNNAGYGIHVMINATDGLGRGLANVTMCRAQLLDSDAIDGPQQVARLCASSTPPHMIVHTSPGKTQSWLKVKEHADKQLYVDNQKRLIGAYNGDVQFIDAAHTARLPGYYHTKEAPSLVTVAAGPRWGTVAYDPWEIAAPLLHIPLVGPNAATRQPLGYAAWAAPSLEWLQYALWKIDPNTLNFHDWIAVTAATKQAGWLFGEAAVRGLWDQWCSYHRKNDHAENNKQWASLTETSSGWQAIVKRAGIAGDLLAAGLGGTGSVRQENATNQQAYGARQDGGNAAVAGQDVSPVQVAAETAAFGSFLTPAETASYLAGCVWVTSEGRILGPNGRLMDQNKFNGLYGGKTFVLDDGGSLTSRVPWDAALRGPVWSVPKVDHMRFIPTMPQGAITTDDFGRTGVNTYQPPVQRPVAGDVQPFLDHVTRLISNPHDRGVLLAFMAQCVQRPGVKVKWGVVLQSMEGAGKTIFEQVMQSALGRDYVYSPAPRELTEGGGKFNGWMRNKLMILINEVKTDEKRELIEVMKPWITEYRIEMQNKGADQGMADNPTNFMMFTNFKDAWPITRTSRRVAIIYCDIQRVTDLERLGMNGDYFQALYRWAASGGASAVAEWLGRYQVPEQFDAERGCTRAPETSATNEALRLSRTWLEETIAEAVESGRQGFRNGWVSTVAVTNLLRETGHKVSGPRSIPNALLGLGYERIGRATKVYNQEFSPAQTHLWNLNAQADLHKYGVEQGYEPS